jgi:hypothetical protein
MKTTWGKEYKEGWEREDQIEAGLKGDRLGNKENKLKNEQEVGGVGGMIIVI